MKRFGIFLNSLILLISFGVSGQELLTSSRYGMSGLGVGSELYVGDASYIEETPAVDYKVDRRYRVELIYNRNSQSDNISGLKWKLNVSVQNPTTNQTEVLVLEHLEAGVATYSSWADFSGVGASMNWKVTAISVQKLLGATWVSGLLSELPLQDIHLEAQVLNDRIVKMATTAPKMSLSGDLLSWDYVKGAVEYDVEWVFIGEFENFVYNSSQPSGPFTFKEPVRITTYKHDYKLDLVYPKGTVYFRVRPRGYDQKYASSQFIYYSGEWSYIKKVGTGNLQYVVSSDYASTFTWQYSVAYAENGMSKSQITYYDGSLRARQQLSQMKSTGQVVAAASLYDHEGRQTIEVIPTPINSNSLNYYSLLHKDASGGAFDKTDYDIAQPLPMGTSSGAGAYYSSFNPLTSDPFRSRVPDAEGYPYSQVVYSNDNTGRPLSSSGVGLTHRMGGGHETRYYYMKPTERDLRELFGSNVGDVSHYDKQVVVDPNGQASVSYTDQQGRVIASGLYGGTAANLVPLDNNSNGAVVSTVASLMSGNDILVDGNGNLQSVVDYYHLNLGTNQITLNYDVLSASLNSVSDYFGIGGCASCFYELEIQVFAPDGSQVNLGYTSQSAPGVYPNSIFERYSASQLNCTSGTYDPALNAISHVYTLNQTGEYHIRKVLRVDQQAVANYLSTAATLPGAPDLSSMVNDFTSNAVTLGCGFDCAAFYEQECREDLGYPLTGTLTTQQQADVAACISDKCDESLSEVENSNDPEEDYCTMGLNKLKQDVSPGGWVYETDLAWRSTSSNWDLNYTMASGGTFNPVSWDDLVSNWEEGWEDALVLHHPEYCHYVKCTTLTVLNDYMNVLQDVSTWSDAVNGGYINSGGDFLSTNDPLNTTSPYSSTFSSVFLSGVNNNYSGSGDNILATVDAQFAANPSWLNDDNGNPLTPAQVADKKWSMIRSLYLGERSMFIEDAYTGCAYYNNPNANFVEPEPASGSNNNPQPNGSNFNCYSTCDGNVSYWMGQITSSCPLLSSTDLADIQGHLQNYCLTDCDGFSNQYGAIQISDINSSNADLVAVEGLLQSYCVGFSLLDLAVDDTCSTPTTITLNNTNVSPPLLTKNLAVLTSLSSTGYNSFITQPAITVIPSYQLEFPASYWQSGMSVQLINTLIPNSVTYLISDIQSIVVLNQYTSGNTIKFDIKVTKINGSVYYHTINKFSLSKSRGGVVDFMINQINSKVTVTYSFCDPGVDPYDVEFSLEDWVDDCIDDIMNEATTLGEQAYASAYEDFINGLTASFSSSCFGSGLTEQFSIGYQKQEYAFTLYYYDQANNLVQTVPPQGVHIVPSSGFSAGGVWLGVEPVHQMKTMYTFNSLNQMVKAQTPDGGVTTFKYNSLQQIRFTQNAVQASQNKYSYMKYDALGRPNEVGVFVEPSSANLSTYVQDNAYPQAGTYTLSEVVRTIYHKQLLVLDDALGWKPVNLNNRIAAVAYYESMSSPMAAYTNAIYYDYDIHGNVSHLLTDLNYTELGTQRYKRIDYNYDVYSGKMLEVVYQANQEDQFLHRYTYDDDNRITAVYTSRDGVKWAEDASYYYYLHGPLARMELGEDKVQGIDYAYTVHGWLKGVNDNTLNARRDLGRDGASQNHVNRWVAQDVFGYSLTYYNNGGTEVDYKPIVTQASDVNWLASNEGVILPSSNAGLYNGNIRAMVTALRGTNGYSIGTVGRVYKYDQLQRLKEAQTWKTSTGSGDLEGSNSWTGAATTTAHYSSYSYDLNGNITRFTRRGATNLIDDMTYNYYQTGGGGTVTLPTTMNQLAYVNDAQTNNALFSDDIDASQAANNYQYDALGRLIMDQQEQIASITWTSINKVGYIQRTAGSQKPDLGFKYDALGRRVLKIEYPKLANGTINTSLIKRTYYALDANGNVMATYSQTGATPSSTMLEEYELYGASRIGIQQEDRVMGSTANFGYCTKDHDRASAIVELRITTFSNTQTVQYKLGTTNLNDLYAWNTGVTLKQNVDILLSLINAKTVTTDVRASYWYSNNAAGVVYLKFEMGQTGNWNGQTLSTYVNGVFSGLNSHTPKRVMGYGTAKGSDRYGAKRYELANQLGNVLAVITDRKWGVDDGVYNLTTGVRTSTTLDGKVDYYTATVVTYSDYDPFGTMQEGRNSPGDGSYRYAFQGQEMDNEIKGQGNSYNYEYRMHDPRLGRFFAVDPLAPKYPHYTPYQFSGNRPIDCVELEGLEPVITGKETIGYTALAVEDGTKDIYYWRWTQCEVSSNCGIYEKIEPYTHPSNEDNAEISNHVYTIFDDEVKIGDEVFNTEYYLFKKYGSKDGYQAALYKRDIGNVSVYVLAFAGTQDLLDGVEDALAGISSDLEYHIKKAIIDSKRIDKWCEDMGAQLSFTGHSLGGGAAAAASAQTGRYACTFNAMGVTKQLQEKYNITMSNAKIDAFIIDGEALDNWQPTKANGYRHEVKPITNNYGADNNMLTMIVRNRFYLHELTRFLEIYRK